MTSSASDSDGFRSPVRRTDPAGLISSLALAVALGGTLSSLARLLQPADASPAAATACPAAWPFQVPGSADASPVVSGAEPALVASSVEVSEPRRVRVRDASGRVEVARVCGDESAKTVVLRDGQIATIQGQMAFTEEPFEPLSSELLAERLSAGDLAGFALHQTPHYLVFSKASERFTRASANLLESIYEGLIEQLRKQGLPVSEAEFPLVAVIFRTEAEFRAHAPVPAEVQAYYNVTTNRIVFFETSHRDADAPDVAAMRQPQTVAHEGAHQVLQNIGLQPRLADWPLWLVEGLAEYFAPTTTSRDGRWAGANRVNPFHMATLRDLKEPHTFQERVGKAAAANSRPHLGGPGPGSSTVEYLVTRETLSPTDYALSWALTHYLANKRFPALLDYLAELSRRRPLEKVTPAQHLADFHRFFGEETRKLDLAINRHLASLKGFDALPYFVVTFEQPVSAGLVQRGALVSQSPATIRQWVASMSRPWGGPVTWRATPFLQQRQALLAAEGWLQSR